MKKYSFFIAGIIQGSIRGESVHDQDYRRRIKEIISTHVEGARVYCPFENHPESLAYDDKKANAVFLDHIEMAKRTDCLVSYLPEASMGTAVEMYAAREGERAVVTISGLTANWTVKFLSDVVFPDIDAFGDFAVSGELLGFLDGFYSRGT